VTDGGFSKTDLISAAERIALVLARDLGLGDEVSAREDWGVDDGDMVLASELSGDAEGYLFLAVNDAVGERLLGDASVLGAAFAAAMVDAALDLGANFECGAAVTVSDVLPTVIFEITDAGAVTSLAGLTLPILTIAEPAHFEPATFDEPVDHGLSHSLAALTVLNDVELVVTAELGRTTMAVRDLLGLTPGMVVEIDRVAGSPIDLLVNGRRIAAGEVVVIDEEFGIRITDIAPIGEIRR